MPSSPRFSSSPRRIATAVDWRTRPLRRRARLAYDLAAAPLRRADVALFHEFSPAPAGGGHQFLRGLSRELRRRGLRVEENRISRGTAACLCNSFNFDFERLRAFVRRDCRMVHRVDGPIGGYRGGDDGSDHRIWEINQELADATVFQSRYSLEAHRELGLEFRDPVVVPNAADPEIFHARGRTLFSRGRPVRLITTSWSDNVNKGAETIARLERELDWSRCEYTWVGHSPVEFERIRRVDPVPSSELADLLRSHDVFVTASLHDPCSNALLEALACGLPALYVDSGGHGELVGEGGLPFSRVDEVPALLEQVVERYESFQKGIRVPVLSEVAARYLEVLGVGP
jgi:glycosyltransferase involved in cell wall biosynthesis